MYLSIGYDAVLCGRDIIGIFHLDNVSRGRDTRRMLRDREQSGRVTTLGDDLPRSLIITEEQDGDRLYLSPVSCGTLVKRISPSAHHTRRTQDGTK